MAFIKVPPGVFIIGENRVDTTKKISSSGNAGAIFVLCFKISLFI